MQPLTLTVIDGRTRSLFIREKSIATPPRERSDDHTSPETISHLDSIKDSYSYELDFCSCVCK